MVSAPTGTFRTSDLDTRTAFPSDPGVSLPFQPSFLHSLAAITADTRDHRGYPTSGFMYRAALTTYSDRSSGTFSFNQWEAEALQFIPIVEKRWILALHGWTVHDAVPSGNEVPFYLLPAIGGNNTLRDYLDFQFHDQNSVVANVESRFGLTTHIDTALFFDAGNVAGRWSDLNFDRTSYGIGFRLHTDTTTIARVDIAQGPLGWHLVFRTTEPLRLSRIRRQIAPIPFAP